MNRITVAAIDDHKFIREMWGLLFSGNSEIDLVGEAGTFDEGIEMVKLKTPDVLLLDINLQDKSGDNAVPVIRKYSPKTKIITVSMHNEPAFAKKMLRLGAKAYITKNSPHKEVFEAIEKVMEGGTYVCSEIKNIIAKQTITAKTYSKPQKFTGKRKGSD